MQRVLVIGPGGAGKSVFAARLAERTGLPLVHLDREYWQPGWIATAPEAWHARVAALVAEPAWILDGNYGGTLEVRIAACDTLVFLDLPAWRCAWRVLRRRGSHRGGASRDSVAPGCPERLDAAFLWWVLSYRRQRRPRVLQRLDGARAAGKRVDILASPREVEAFLARIAPATRSGPGGPR
jgi:adenylate kinase family enzyme